MCISNIRKIPTSVVNGRKNWISIIRPVCMPIDCPKTINFFTKLNFFLVDF